MYTKATTVQFSLVWLFAFMLASTVYAANCKLSVPTCVDSSPTKIFSGIAVSVSEVGGCWKYKYDYTCLKPNAVNYCQPFINAQPQCWQTNSQCSQWDSVLNTGCMKYTQTWRCSDPSRPTPSNTIKLSETYTLISSNYDPGPCQSLDNNPNCSIAESVCVSTTPPITIPPGISPSQVAPDGCYQKQNAYACLTGRTDTSECDGYASNPNCTLQSSSCDPADMVGGQCTFEKKTYRCMSSPPQTNTVTDCSGQLFCQDGKCFDKGYENDPDFARSMALMEAAREAGTYIDPNSLEIFKGVVSRCKIKFLANCCKKSGGGGGYSNNLLFNIVGQVGSNALAYGSRYTYDALYTSDAPNWMVQGMAALVGVDPVKTSSALANWSPSISLYGFTFSFGAAPAPGFFTSALGLPNPISLDSLNGAFGITSGGFYFDPTSFAIQIGLMILQDLLSCDQQEQILAMRRGQNLCYKVGDKYCSKKINLGFTKICLEWTESHCCFNSRLARIINEQGRAQIGKSWGSAQSPNCSGFTQAEFEKIDFSKIDLSEFIAEIMANIKMPDLQGMTQNVQGVVNQKMQNYYQRGRQ
ncbi:conjugal transfer protein TraN [Sulfuricystis multivorans]|uniref:conjugal transfer protein TraN n=1 Tax=Sulfuricystis multivorans TaxID=2211108 RepID=UPI000F82028B|nr:conjugal transfer protein TraN [Sulfuricystis multivorans]